MFTSPVTLLRKAGDSLVPSTVVDFCPQDIDVFTRDLPPVSTTAIDFCPQDIDVFTRTL